jgi:hypothetical protein
MLVGAWAPSFGTFGARWLRLVTLDTTRFTLFAAPPGLSLDLVHFDGLMGSSGDTDEFPLLSRTGILYRGQSLGSEFGRLPDQT